MTINRVEKTIVERELAGGETPVLLMVSGGSDSTALAYIANDLHERGVLGPLAILHVNHRLRGADADKDAAFVQQLADAMQLPFFLVEVDVGEIARAQNDNIEAVARSERYSAAQDALESLCRHAETPVSEGRIFTAHTQTDRVENFYMRSIVGTGPGGFRSMRYANGAVVRPCLDVTREDLRDYLRRRALDAQADASVVCISDEDGNLWREDATNAHTDQFRGYVRHEIVPKARARNPRLEETLCRSMNLIADEDDMLDEMTRTILASQVSWTHADKGDISYEAGCVLAPEFGANPVPLQRRAIALILQAMLGEDARVETASIETVVKGFENGVPISGYTGNIQGDIALSANKRGLVIEPMDTYRARRKPHTM